MSGYKSGTQQKNIAWFLPRPKSDHYRGGMPLYCEEWLIELANDILGHKGLLLNIFAGMNKLGITVDIKKNVNPDICYDVHSLTDFFIKTPKEKLPKPFNLIPWENTVDIILADPPYSTEEAKELYRTPKLNYKKWTTECDKLLKVGGLLIVYHKYIMPNPNPQKYEVVKRVFIGNRTYHLPRVAIFFKKIKN